MKAALYKSLALHAVVFLLFMVDLPLFWREDMVVSQPPIIVDLEQVKISEITNLPAKAKIAEETKTPARAKKMPPKPEPKPRGAGGSAAAAETGFCGAAAAFQTQTAR